MKQQMQSPQTFRMHSRYVQHARRDALRHATSCRPVARSPRVQREIVLANGNGDANVK